MYFHKIDNPSNFSFAGERSVPVSQQISALGESVFRVIWKSRLWRSTDSIATLDTRVFRRRRSEPDDAPSVELRPKPDDGFALAADGRVVLETEEGSGFGLCGTGWVVRLVWDESLRFYGLGEKCGRLEKRGARTKFWNTDVFADFEPGAISRAETDPMYVSVPYLLIRTELGYVGILINNPYVVFMNLGAIEGVSQQQELETRRDLYFGAPNGRPEIYIIYGRSAAQVTSRLQRLCGVTPRPPLWALGHHQCRWGYESYDDLRGIGEQFSAHGIPNDGLWLDIEYMRGYRVFTFEKRNFSNPAKQIGALNARGAHVCPIIDPGVKIDPEYPVFTEAAAQNVLCLNSEGRPFTGFVWPGRTAFPDFSLDTGRRWWAGQVRTFATSGISGAWLDMNDPSTGSCDPGAMRFDHGRRDHEYFHNQYALGMQMASREGFLAANPDLRPFLLSRSGFISTSRFSAVWTGDNESTYTYLAQSIPMCLNLSLSGIPFVGSDVGGFGGDTTPDLLVDWYKAAFLFPFFRNHTVRDSRRQEPWAMGATVRNIIREYIRLRYRLLPYLYNLFIEQESSGTPILRPLFFELDSRESASLEAIDDQFMVGPAILQAPVVTADTSSRTVVLPPGSWYDPAASAWVRGERTKKVTVTRGTTPLYVRDGSVVPMQPDDPTDNRTDLAVVQFHLFVRKSGAEGSRTRYRYTFDDGSTFGYRDRAAQSVYELDVSVRRGVLEVDISRFAGGYGELRAEFVIYDEFRSVRLRGGRKIGDGRTTTGSAAVDLPLRGYSFRCCGSRVSCRRTERFTV